MTSLSPLPLSRPPSPCHGPGVVPGLMNHLQKSFKSAHREGGVKRGGKERRSSPLSLGINGHRDGDFVEAEVTGVARFPSLA